MAIMHPIVEQEAMKAQPDRFLLMNIQMAAMETAASAAMP